MTVYYADFSVASTGNDGLTPGTPFGINEAIPVIQTSNNTVNAYGENLVAVPSFSVAPSTLLQSYLPSVNGPCRILCSGQLTVASSGELRDVIVECGTFSLDALCRAVNCAIRCNSMSYTVGFYLGGSPQASMIGCTIDNVGTLDLIGNKYNSPPASQTATLVFLDCVHQYSAVTVSHPGSGSRQTDFNLNFSGCYTSPYPSYNTNVGGGIGTTAPTVFQTASITWPGISAPRLSWSINTLGAAIVDPARAGTAPYTVYPDGLWASVRSSINGGIGAFEMLPSSQPPNGIQIKDGGTIRTGTGSPVGNYNGSTGDLYLQTDGAAGSCLWVKESGTNDALGWIAVQSDTYQVKVDGADVAPDFLFAKLTAGSNISLTNLGATVQIDATIPPQPDELVKIDGSDTTPGYLADKLTNKDQSVTLTILDAAGDESLNAMVDGNFLHDRILPGTNIEVVPGDTMPPFTQAGDYLYQQNSPPFNDLLTNALAPAWTDTVNGIWATSLDAACVVKQIMLAPGMVIRMRTKSEYDLGQAYRNGIWIMRGPIGAGNGSLPSHPGPPSFFYFGMGEDVTSGPNALRAVKVDTTGPVVTTVFGQSPNFLTSFPTPVILDVVLTVVNYVDGTSDLVMRYDITAVGAFGTQNINGTFQVSAFPVLAPTYKANLCFGVLNSGGPTPQTELIQSVSVDNGSVVIRALVNGMVVNTRTVTAATTILATDVALTFNSATAIAQALPAATGSGRLYYLRNSGAGAVTLTTPGGTINEESSQVLNQGDSVIVIDEAANIWGIR